MRTCELFILADRVLGPVEGPLWGQFIEFVGRCIHGGIYDPGSPAARSDGVRADVLEAMKELRPTHLRYPGGCAVSYFDWQELVGPRAQRPPAKLYRYTGVPQSTAFGLPEAFAYAEELGAELYLTVNAHTQSPEDAANLVEYLNGTTRTRWADLRRSHGREKPYGIKRFGLGNEIYGDWQPGQKTAEEYVRWCREAIRWMKAVDPTMSIAAVGMGRPGPDWDRTVLKGLIDSIDLFSVHNYCGRPVFRDCMAASRVYETMIEWANVAIDEAMDTRLSRKERPGIALDEWNVWYRARHAAEASLEEIYDYTDALTVATLLHVVLRHTRTVRLSNISLAANTCGSIFTDRQRCVRQTIFYPQMLFREKHTGEAVQTFYDGPVFPAKHERYFCGIVDVEKAKDETLPTLLHFDDLDALDALCTVDRGRRRLSLSVVNKLEDRALTARLSFRGIEPRSTLVRVYRLTGPSLQAANTLDHPSQVGLVSAWDRVAGSFPFPAASLTLLEFEI
ncbi:MAG: hypothetical protein HYU36_05315 [Planctomycetes bacterium]|nr:hypothetical protein [Planctomycetota bacterium]